MSEDLRAVRYGWELAFRRNSVLPPQANFSASFSDVVGGGDEPHDPNRGGADHVTCTTNQIKSHDQQDQWNEKLRTVIFGMHYIRFEWNMVKEKAVSRINK